MSHSPCVSNYLTLQNYSQNFVSNEMKLLNRGGYHIVNEVRKTE